MNKNLPLRQIILLCLTICAGLFIIVSYNFSLIDLNILSLYILFYSIGVPLGILFFDTLIDLNNSKIYNIWLLIGIIQLCFYLMTKNNENFTIYRDTDVNDSLINKSLINTTTSALKALLIFLLAYKFFNIIMLKLTGNFILNTYKQDSWEHELINRKITKLDVFFNFLLLAVIALAVLF